MKPTVLASTLRQPIPRHQRGVTLVVALIFLAVLSLLGVTAAQVMSQEERMTGNTRSRDQAFQAAEEVLSHVEANLDPAAAYAGTIATPGSNGLYTFDLCLPNSQVFWNGTAANDCHGVSQPGFDWNAANATQTRNIQIGGEDVVAEPSKYIVEKMSDLAGAKRYRVTVRAVGGDANAVVILQAIFTAT